MNRFQLLALAAFLTLTPALLSAQATLESPRSTISVQVGSSFYGSVISLFTDDLETVDEDGIDVSRTPVIHASYDYQINDWFSAGGSASFQNFSVKSNDGNVDVDRFNVGVRGLFHYGSNPNLDMYSGVRVGLNIWNPTFKAATEEFKEDFEADFSGVLPSIQFVAFGLRGYFTQNFGLNMEVALGAPYYFTVGVNYRF